MNAHLLTFMFATASKDLWVVLGVLVAIAFAVFGWVRREDRRERASIEAQEAQQGPPPGPLGN